MPRAIRLGANTVPTTNARATKSPTLAGIRGQRISARRGVFSRATTLSGRDGSVCTQPSH